MSLARITAGRKGMAVAAQAITSRQPPLKESPIPWLEEAAKASAFKFARAALAEKDPEQKAGLYAQAAEQATRACMLRAALLFDKYAMKHFREVPGYSYKIEHPLARKQRIESGKRYLASADDPASSWTGAERKTLREYANARMPDNQGSEIRGSGVPKSERYYDQWL